MPPLSLQLLQEQLPWTSRNPRQKTMMIFLPPSMSKVKINELWFPNRLIIFVCRSTVNPILKKEPEKPETPPQKHSVPTYRLSLKFSNTLLCQCGGDLHRTHYCATRSHYLESKKWPFENPWCAHLSVAWRLSSPRPLGVSAGGPRLLESTVWILGSASWAPLGNKIWRRVHW